MAATLNAGKLRHLVEFQRPTETSTRHAKGQRITEYATIESAYCSMKATTVDEEINGQVRSQTRFEFQTWYMPLPIDSSWRLKIRNRFFAVDSVENFQEENAVLIINASEKNNG